MRPSLRADVASSFFQTSLCSAAVLPSLSPWFDNPTMFMSSSSSSSFASSLLHDNTLRFHPVLAVWDAIRCFFPILKWDGGGYTMGWGIYYPVFRVFENQSDSERQKRLAEATKFVTDLKCNKKPLNLSNLGRFHRFKLFINRFLMRLMFNGVRTFHV
jgi:hypothetical protein